MKKTITVLATLAVLIAVVLLADRATRKPTIHAREKAAQPAVAPFAAEFTLKDLQDKDVSLAQFKGKVVLINFWATWCEPCRDEIPWFIELHQKYASQGLVVLGIAMDQEGKQVVVPYVERERFPVGGKPQPMSYTILIGNEDVEQKYGGVIGYPTTFLLSRDGRLNRKIIGRVNYEDLESSIKSLL